MTGALRPFSWADAPLVAYLTRKGVSLDSEYALTHGLRCAQDALLATLPLEKARRPAYLMRYGRSWAMGQLRLLPGWQGARLAFMAPHLSQGADDNLWMALLDGLTEAAGARGAHLLVADVDESGLPFDVLRGSHFAVYA